MTPAPADEQVPVDMALDPFRVMLYLRPLSGTAATLVPLTADGVGTGISSEKLQSSAAAASRAGSSPAPAREPILAPAV